LAVELILGLEVLLVGRVPTQEVLGSKFVRQADRPKGHSQGTEESESHQEDGKHPVETSLKPGTDLGGFQGTGPENTGPKGHRAGTGQLNEKGNRHCPRDAPECSGDDSREGELPS